MSQLRQRFGGNGWMRKRNRAKKSPISPLNTGIGGETGDAMSRGLKVVLILSLASLALTACGKRGALEAPPAATTTDKSVEPKPNEKPHRGFILDPLLR
jgi:predicted small lipoprotein YifL